MIYHETNPPFLSAFKEPPAETSRMLRIPEHTLHAETHTHTMRVTFSSRRHGDFTPKWIKKNCMCTLQAGNNFLDTLVLVHIDSNITACLNTSSPGEWM